MNASGAEKKARWNGKQGNTPTAETVGFPDRKTQMTNSADPARKSRADRYRQMGKICFKLLTLAALCAATVGLIASAAAFLIPS